MTIQEAVEKAIEGGYVADHKARFIITVHPEQCHKQIGDHFALDPLFWQALGKAMGWGVVTKLGTNYESFISLYARRSTGERQWERKEKIEEWLYRWHRLIDHLAEGGTIESYFATLKP